MRWLFYMAFVSTATLIESERFIENEDFETVEVMVNDVATLRCNVSVASAFDKITLIIWYKNSSSVPIYSVDMRERQRPEYADHWSDKKIMEGRASFKLDSGSLVIEHVRTSDEGLYKCRIDFKQSPTKYFEIQLVVVVPIRNITILEATRDPELTDHSFVLPAVMEGNSLTATCVAIGGNPRPNVYWWRNNQLLDRTFELFEDRATNVVFLDRVGRENVDDKLICRATNSKLAETATAAVSVNLYLPPEKIALLGTNNAMSAGQRYEITCQVMGSRPPANVTWLKNSEILSTPATHSVSSDRIIVTSTVTLAVNESDSGQILTCVASNLLFPNQTITDSWTLKVKYAPVIAITLGSNLNSSSIREGADVYFECHVRADPWITKIKWLHNNRLVTNNAGTGIIVSNQTLVLQSVTRQSSGYYRCAASNSEGESASKPLALDVKYEPVCRANQQRVYGAERNEEIDITCEVDGNPSPSWFRWTFNNSMVRMVPVGNFLNENGSSVIKFKPSTETQYGTLLCSSRNDLGPQVVPCVFHVVSAGRPDPPHNCSVVNLTQSWLFVKCLRGFDGGLPQEFICEVARKWNDKVISNITSKSQPEFRVTGLEARTSYAVVIYSANVKGKSKENVLLRVTTLPNVTEQSRRSMGRSSAFLNSYWNEKMIIGAAAIVSVVVVVFIVVLSQIIVIRKRKKRRPRSERIRKVELSRVSLTHSEDDRNPDLIPQSTAIGLTYPLVSSISVQTSTSDTDVSILPVIEKSNSTTSTYLEANRLEELIWPPTKWPATVEPIMLVLPETIPIVSRQNAETQTPGSPISRKESTV